MTTQRFQNISRRALLKGIAGTTGLMAASGLLSACAAPASPAGSGEAQSAPGTEVIEVYTIVPGFFADMSITDATALYNEQIADSGVRIIVEETPDGWETKALAMLREGNIRWSATGYSQFDEQFRHIKTGLAQPIDDLIQSSQVPWAADHQNSFYYSKIYDTTVFEGSAYFIPMKLNIFMTGYRKDYLEEAGYDALPQTWDEFEIMLGKLLETLADRDVVPFAVRKDIFRSLGIAFTTFVDNPYDEEFMLKIDSEEFRQCIGMFRRWFDQEYTNVQLMQDPMPDWQLGKVALSFDSHSWLRIGRSVLGNDVIAGDLPPKTDPNNPWRSWVHVDSSFVFQDAPYPQEGLDWLLSIFGPEGAPADRHWSGTLSLSGMPVHQNQYERLLVNGDASPELLRSYDAVPGSTMVPMEAGKYLPTINAKLIPWMERYWGGEVEVEEALQSALTEIKEVVDEQIS